MEMPFEEQQGYSPWVRPNDTRIVSSQLSMTLVPKASKHLLQARRRPGASRQSRCGADAVLKLIQPLADATTETFKRFIEMHELFALGVVDAR